MADWVKCVAGQQSADAPAIDQARRKWRRVRSQWDRSGRLEGTVDAGLQMRLEQARRLKTGMWMFALGDFIVSLRDIG
ncbi:MAG: hypothetical protein E5Y12_24450 [Mesorhizobium sp.]|nr:MAG: hypothetical protein E5Y12_24450 [Mesorhizobium sp.]